MKQFMFVYGTLRPGQYNAGRFGPEAEVVKRDVRVPGRMRCAFLHGNGGYPYVDFDEDHAKSSNGSWDTDWTCGTVVGDIIRLDSEDPAYYQICRMEAGAGYAPVGLHIATDSVRTTHVMRVLAWHKPRFDEERGPIIPDGDWLAWDKAHPEPAEDS